MTAPKTAAQPAPPLTGHTLCDALLPASQALVGAVRRQDLRAAHEAVAEAHRVGRDTGDRQWIFHWLITMAALVPDDQTPRELLAWVDQPRPPRLAS